jgi:hypothetical protein
VIWYRKYILIIRPIALHSQELTNIGMLVIVYYRNSVFAFHIHYHCVYQIMYMTGILQMMQEPLSALAAEFQSGSPILQEKIKVLVDLAILIRNNCILCWSFVSVCCVLICSYSSFYCPQLLGEQYVALRRTRGDGNCFYRCFMFSYLVVTVICVATSSKGSPFVI